nr:reverse transcriptase domain-containing protein [Tanacetum cinerariifolium]
MDEFPDSKVAIPIQQNHRKAKSKENTGNSVYNSRNAKTSVTGETVTLRSSMTNPLECTLVSGPGTPQPLINQVTEEKIQIAIHPEYPEQTIAIRSTLTEEGRNELCDLLRRNLDIFAWKLAYMTGVPRHIAEHSLNYHQGCLPVRQKKRGQASERNKAIYEEVKDLVDAEAVFSFPSPKCLKDVQRLNGKLASPNRFLSKSAKKSLSFFKTLRKCTKKSDFQWTAKAEMAFKQMKTLIAELHMLTAPKKRRIGHLPGGHQRSRQCGPNDGKERKANAYILQGLDIHYRSRTSVKGHIRVDFIVERPEDDLPNTPMKDNVELSEPWILFTDGSSCIDGSIVGLIITNPEGVEFTYALRFRFHATNNEAKYEALIEKSIDEKEVLAIVEEEGHPWMTPIYEYLTEEILPKKRGRQDLYAARQANYVLREIHEGSCSMHVGPRSVVAKALRLGNGETPFSLTYGTKVVIPVEIDIPTLRTAKVDMIKNNEALEINLDLLEEKREQAAIQEAKSKAMMEKYYNARVRNTSFRPGDLVYRCNKASHAEEGGKLGPKWEGPYEVKKH